jgi:16S rRNA (cytosine1402-N4)-methyltransferase
MRYLCVKEGGAYFDGTAGGGGHSELILSAGKNVCLITADKDAEAVAYAGQRLARYGSRVTLVKDDFKHAPQILSDAGVDALDGALLDLGISSRQIDEAERGFSYTKDAPLDMRMDRTQIYSARELVNEYTEEDLRTIFWNYGEERFARKIVAAIVKRRAQKKIETTAELAALIAATGKFDSSGHPAKRVFQALRIEVNGELERLDTTLKFLTSKLKVGGRIVVISFHSLEDRIVKQTLRTLEQKCLCPPKFPICTCGKRQEIKILTTKPVTPTDAELKENPRAASAKLRAALKV